MTEKYTTLDAALVTALPMEVHTELALWQERNECKLHLVRALTSGYTDAFVGVVVAHDETGGRKIILKVDQGSIADESQVHETALRTAPTTYAQDHLVTQVFAPLRLDNDWFVMFQGVAGGGLTDYKPLSVYSRRAELSQLLPNIASSVLHDWTPSPQVQEVSLRHFMELHVRKKLSEEGVVRDWIASLFGSEACHVPYFRFSDSMNPDVKILNPLHIWNDDKSDEYKFHSLMGNSHGDLHLENILIEVTEVRNGNCGYRLIDLATYKSDAPLSRDFTNLFISEIERAIPELDSEARSDLMRTLTIGAMDVTNAILAISNIWKDLQKIADTETINRGLHDDWHRQVSLSLAGAALQSASRQHRSTADRLWFLELASRLLHDVFSGFGALPASNEVHEITLPEQKSAAEVEDIATAVASACGQFTGECLTIAIIDGNEYQKQAHKMTRFSAWDVIVDFDPLSDRSGLFKTAKDHDARHRWFPENDGPATRSVSTLWLPGVPLASPSGDVRTLTPREWRSSELPRIRKAVQKIVSSHPGTVTLVQFGTITPKIRAVVECITDAAGDRADLVVINYQQEAELNELEPVSYTGDPMAVLLALPPRQSTFSGQPGIITIPGGEPGERVAIDESTLNWYSDVGELLHSEIDSVIEDVERLEGDFYSGRKISWLELSEGWDIPRKVTNIRREQIEERMSKRGTYRETLKHVPGSGGTTVARKLVWDLREIHPVMVVEDIPAIMLLAERIADLAELTNRQCVVLIEKASDAMVADLYNHLKARSTPVSLVVVSRRSTPSPHFDLKHGVGPLSRPERADFARVFVGRTSDAGAQARIRNIGLSGGDPAVPFFYALNAYQKDYKGLQPFIAAFIQKHHENVQPSLVDIALVHRFANKSLPGRVISHFLGNPYANNQALRTKFHESAENLLLEEPLGCWRTTHTLVAEELIRQLVETTVGDTPRDWTLELLVRTKDLIIRIAEAYQDEVPELIMKLLRALFIDREQQDELDSTPRALFSDLVSTIPTYSEREELFVTLTSYFSEEPHFIAHHARLRSYQGKDYGGARSLIDAAVDKSPRDANLVNIKGVVIRNEVYRHLDLNYSDRWSLDADYRQGLSELIREALATFKESERLDNRSENNAVLILSMATRTITRLKPKDVTFSEFLTRPTSAVLTECFDEAEDAVYRVEEIYGDASLSDRVEGALNDFKALRDDPEGVLQGWRNMLDTTRGAKGPIRNRLARLYWDKSSFGKETKSARKSLELLEENLRDNPYDVKAIRLWLEVGRRTGASLDQAAIHCRNWVEASRSRESLYYDWSISALLMLSKRMGEKWNYDRKLDQMRAAGKDMRNYRDIFEWFGHGTGLDQLVSAKDPRLAKWERKNKESLVPTCIKRVNARVKYIDSRQAGWLELDNQLQAFFTPHAAGMQRGNDEGALVTALIGLAHDGPIAWSVERRQP